jgi:hypothetical protein
MRQPAIAIVEVAAPWKSAVVMADQQGQEQTKCRGGLNPTGVKATAALWGMLGDISRSTAILAAKRQTLQHAQRDQDHRRGEADLVGRR